MTYTHILRESAKRFGNITCMGIDPDLDKIPFKEKPREAIIRFYSEIFEAMDSEACHPSAIKPNIAFFEQYGFEGLDALKSIIESAGQYGIPVILDAKRGDIGKTAVAYAKNIFDFWNADSVTLHPYLGYDSIGPFMEYKNKGAYVQVRNSNPTAKEIQDLMVDGVPIYMKVAELLLKWDQAGLGAVVGATYPDELRKLSKMFVKSGKEIPMLIPGVGRQGGSATEVMNILRETENDLAIHRINSSSGISYAYLNTGSDDYAQAAIDALKKLNEETKI
jgi:orotidine-5'-phosphate decarboxylase